MVGVYTADYSNYPLDGGFARVKRTGEHLGELKPWLDAVFLHQANAIEIEFDPKPPYRIVRASAPPSTYFGMRFAILVGEICYNLRSALDYLIFELAKLDSGGEQSGTQFPIESKPEGFAGRRKSYLKGVNDAHVAAIERLQPYNGCHWAEMLREASNPDKHRHFVKVGGEFTATIHSSLDTDLSRVLGHARKANHPVLGPVDVKVHMTGGITFRDGPPVIETLEEIKTGVAQTLRDFEPEFERKGVP